MLFPGDPEQFWKHGNCSPPSFAGTNLVNEAFRFQAAENSQGAISRNPRMSNEMLALKYGALEESVNRGHHVEARVRMQIA
jgi:hypothetical protein